MSEKRSRRREGGEGGGSGRPKKPKRPEVRVMDESGQTNEERRELRLKQRTLKNKIIEQQADIGDLNKDACRELTLESGKQSEQSKYPREAANDAENLKLLAGASSGQSSQISKGSVGIDGDAFLDSIKKHFGRTKGDDEQGVNTFNWAKWGGNVSMVYLATPEGGGFMMGPLDKPTKERKAAQRREKHIDDAEEITPMMEMKGSKKAKQNKDQTQMRITDMREHERKKEDAGSKRDMFETLINPKSFTQTVENLFDFSFFVKSGEGHITIDPETKLPQVKFDQSIQSGDAPPANSRDGKQWLMSFTP
ncbi:unnamed protein product, partial [Ectocarpus sp. 4 AP-2014]